MKKIGLVIPVKNESQSIERLINSINSQVYQPDEIVIVDGGSSDNTVELLGRLINNDSRYKIIKTPEASPGKGRNIGTAAANTEWIAYTDAGIRLDDHWLEELVKASTANPEAFIIYGNYKPIQGSFFEKCAAIAFIAPEVPGVIRDRFIASSLIKKRVWEEAKGFPDLRASEDHLFMEAVEKLGYKPAFAPAAQVYWQLRPDLASTYKRFEIYSMNNVWAGRAKYWQYGMARQYLILLVFVALGIWHHWLWFLFLPLWLMARAAKRILIHRYEFGLKTLFNPIVLLTVMWQLFVIDIAAYSGWLKALIRRKN